MNQPHAVQTDTPALPGQNALCRLQADFDALDACHQQVLDILGLLSGVCDRLRDGDMSPDVRKDARQIVAFFEGAAHEHHAEEDRLVFPPLLEGSDVALSRQVRRLQQDHAWLEQDRVELKLQLDAVAKGYSWHDVDALRANVGVFTGLYFDHIDLEESLIYPNARRRLSERANAGAARLAAEQQRQRAA